MSPEKNPFEINQATDLKVASLLDAVSERGFAVIRGLFPREQIRAALEGIKSGFDPSQDHPGMSDRPADVMQNYQKLIIGGGAQANYYVPRFLRVIYNPLWAEDIYGMHAIFRRLAALRNHVQGHRSDYAVDRVEDSVWTAARLQQYPVGGGFFMSHRDAISASTTNEAGMLKFIQLILLITERGVDYETGGTFVDTEGGRVDLEAECGSGDVIVYDGRSVHGVSDIDPHRLPDLKGPSGRIAALVTLYADLTRNESQYQEYRRKDFASN